MPPYDYDSGDDFEYRFSIEEVGDSDSDSVESEPPDDPPLAFWKAGLACFGLAGWCGLSGAFFLKSFPTEILLNPGYVLIAIAVLLAFLGLHSICISSILGYSPLSSESESRGEDR